MHILCRQEIKSRRSLYNKPLFFFLWGHKFALWNVTPYLVDTCHQRITDHQTIKLKPVKGHTEHKLIEFSMRAKKTRNESLKKHFYLIFQLF